MNNHSPSPGEAPDAVLRQMASLATPMALRVAATLRLPDRIGDDGATASELAGATGTSPAAMIRLLDHLVSLRVIERADSHGDSPRYQTTELGDCLREDRGGGALRDDLDIGSALGRAELSFVQLQHTITTGQPGYQRHYGQDFWTDLAAAPALQASFDAKMTRRIREKAPQIARSFDWGRYQTLVDVGGGQGHLLAAILAAHPGLRGQLLDLAATAAQARQTFAAAGQGDRATAMPGSFFEPLPAGAEAYLLCDILHDWDDEHAHTILERCTHAAGTAGRVLIIEPVRGRDADTGIDLAMMVFFGGRERSERELTELAASHHLALESTTSVAADRTLLEFTAAG